MNGGIHSRGNLKCCKEKKQENKTKIEIKTLKLQTGIYKSKILIGQYFAFLNKPEGLI